MITASQLFHPSEPGPHGCFFCAFPCTAEYHVKDYVKSTFTNRDEVRNPGSEYICGGCVASMEQGNPITLFDGTVMGPNVRIGPRMFSWVLSRSLHLGFTKAHISELRTHVLNPPEPPFSIILADSGQKQLIFRAPVALDKDNYRLLLEDETITVVRDELSERIDLAKRLIAAIGKPALTDWESVSHGIRVYDYFGSIDYLEQWNEIRSEPLSRLAVWLAPPMEVCKNEYHKIESCRISADACGADRSSPPGSGQDRQDRCEKSLYQPGFDFPSAVQ